MPSKHPWLMKRSNRYYLRAKVPVYLRKIAGKSEIKKSLKTTDRRKAESLLRIEAAAVESEFQRWRVGAAVASSGSCNISASQLEELARSWFQERLSKVQRCASLGTDQQLRDAELHDAALDELAILAGGEQNLSFAQPKADALLASLGVKADWKTSIPHDLTHFILRAELECLRIKMRLLEGDYSYKTNDPLFAQQAPSHLAPQLSADERPLNFKIEDWKNYISKTMKARQVSQYLADVAELAQGIKTVEQFRKRNLQAVLEKQLEHLSPNTIIRKFTTYRSYWTYLEKHELVSTQVKPFDGVTLPSKRAQISRQEWSPEEICKLWKAACANNRDTLANVIRIAAYTGGRLEAICSLRSEHIGTDSKGQRYIHFSDKTAAGHRDVPIHSNLQPLINDLLKGANERAGFLLGLETSNKHHEFSSGIGKQFGRLKTQLGYGKERVFHSIRRTVTKMLYAECHDEKLVADIIGHKMQSMTFHYMDEAKLHKKAACIEKALVFPDIDFELG